MKKLLLTLLTVLLIAPLGRAASEKLELWVSSIKSGSDYSPQDKWELYQSPGSGELAYPGTSESSSDIKYFVFKSKNSDEFVKITFSQTVSLTFSTSSRYGLYIPDEGTKITIETSKPQLKVNSVSLSGYNKNYYYCPLNFRVQ